MTLTEAVRSLHPTAVFGSKVQGGNFVVGQTLDDQGNVGPEKIVWWDEEALGPLDEAAVEAAAAAPAPAKPRSIPGAALVHVLDKATKVAPKDLAYVSGLSSAREDQASIIRIAGVAGLKVQDWFDMALA